MNGFCLFEANSFALLKSQLSKAALSGKKEEVDLDITSQSPDIYKNRFMKYCSKNVFADYKPNYFIECADMKQKSFLMKCLAHEFILRDLFEKGL